jgi:hypothetical protein
MALGGGGFFGGGPGPGGDGLGWYHPQGPYGMWPSCGCGTIFIILGGLLLAFGGCINMMRNPYGW